MLAAIQAWLGETFLAMYVRDVVSVKALLESAHILANAVILFSVGTVGLRLMGLAGLSTPAQTMVRRFSPFIWSALAVVVVTGLVLLTGAGRRGLTNPMFAVKLTTMITAALATAALQVTLQSNAQFWEMTAARRASARLIAPLCFLLWVATVLAGRWLAYSQTFFPSAY
jgi:hypothetical protein